MGSFLRENGASGFDEAKRTATGYVCASTYENCYDNNCVKLFIRNIVGADALPYIDIGFSHINESDTDILLEQIKNCFTSGGFVEKNQSSKLKKNNFIKHHNSVESTVALRFPVKHNKIKNLVSCLNDIISPVALKFVEEQESIPNNLERSILAFMGNELSRGPGGLKVAKNRAQKLAHDFKFGYADEALMT